MPTDNELTITLENLINTLRYSGWKASLESSSSDEEMYIVAEKENSKIVIKVLKQPSHESLEALRLYAKNIKATPYIKQTNSAVLEKIAI